MIRKLLGLIFAGILVAACIFKAVLAILGFILVIVAWLI